MTMTAFLAPSYDHVVATEELRRNLSEVLGWIEDGQTVLLSRYNKPVAVLTGVTYENTNGSR